MFETLSLITQYLGIVVKCVMMNGQNNGRKLLFCMKYVNENAVLDEWQPTIIAIICY
jgi:hypothetical protein